MESRAFHVSPVQLEVDCGRSGGAQSGGVQLLDLLPSYRILDKDIVGNRSIMPDLESGRMGSATITPQGSPLAEVCEGERGESLDLLRGTYKGVIARARMFRPRQKQIEVNHASGVEQSSAQPMYLDRDQGRLDNETSVPQSRDRSSSDARRKSHGHVASQAERRHPY